MPASARAGGRLRCGCDMPTCGSLFSGIGGLDLGLQRAGFTIRWQVERDAFCRRVLARHWPAVPRYADICELDVQQLERVELIAGGFPCQPVSVAGNQRAQADARWLWPEFARVVRALRPALVLVENVPGLLVGGVGDVVGDLAACGYDTEWDCLPASAVGADHVRDRVWIVAYADGRRCEVWRGAQLHRVERPSRRFPDRRSVVWQFADAADAWGSSAESELDRVADGVPGRVDRLRALGNAVVPQIAEWLGRRLMATLQ